MVGGGWGARSGGSSQNINDGVWIGILATNRSENIHFSNSQWVAGYTEIEEGGETFVRFGYSIMALLVLHHR